MTMPSNLHIAVFTKPLVPGDVKTRLIPAFGADGAVAIQRDMLWQTLTVAQAVAGQCTSLWVAGDTNHPTLRPCRAAFGIPVQAQLGNDLGARMRSAMSVLLPKHTPVLLIGCDCPALSADNMRAAATRLVEAGKGTVFIPAEDGGYVLIGMDARAERQPAMLDAVFHGIEWGTDQVMAQTRTQLANAGLDWMEQPPLWDVDRPEDVRRAQALGLLGTAS